MVPLRIYNLAFNILYAFRWSTRATKRLKSRMQQAIQKRVKNATILPTWQSLFTRTYFLINVNKMLATIEEFCAVNYFPLLIKFFIFSFFYETQDKCHAIESYLPLFWSITSIYMARCHAFGFVRGKSKLSRCKIILCVGMDSLHICEVIITILFHKHSIISSLNYIIIARIQEKLELHFRRDNIVYLWKIIKIKWLNIKTLEHR